MEEFLSSLFCISFFIASLGVLWSCIKLCTHWLPPVQRSTNVQEPAVVSDYPPPYHTIVSFKDISKTDKNRFLPNYDEISFYGKTPFFKRSLSF